jgi:CRP/FNR family transcriptional regulator, cyclic AMP receptor protein
MSTAAPDLLRIVPFFAQLDDEAYAALSRRCHIRHFKARDLILGHGDESFDVLFMLDGLARVNIYSPDGYRVSFREISRGTIFGELSALDGAPRSASVESVEDCAVAIMRRQDFAEALAEYPPFMMAVMKHLTGQVRRLTTRVVEFSTLNVRHRVQAELLRLAGDAKANEAILSPAPTHAEIASRISTHREAVTRELAWLEERGLVAKQGRALKITDLESLRDLVEEMASG